MVLRIVGTAFLSVVALFVITKLMGHKQVAQLDCFEYVSGITIGSIGAEMATDLESPWRALVALAVYGVVALILNVLTSKFPRARKYINGTPCVLMEKGKIYRKNLKKAKLDLSEFMMQCRELGYFNLDEIEMAIFEANGRLSILPKAECRPMNLKDFDLGAREEKIGVEMVMDGRILGENLKRLGRNQRWLFKEISRLGFHDVKGIFLGIYHPENGEFSIYSDGSDGE